MKKINQHPIYIQCAVDINKILFVYNPGRFYYLPVMVGIHQASFLCSKYHIALDNLILEDVLAGEMVSLAQKTFELDWKSKVPKNILKLNNVKPLSIKLY